jgi:hypothetical protein
LLDAREARRFGAGGTFAPARRASAKPIAMACLRLVTFLPDPPLRSVPFLRSCMARSTFLEALLLDLVIVEPFDSTPARYQSLCHRRAVALMESVRPGVSVR